MLHGLLEETAEHDRHGLQIELMQDIDPFMPNLDVGETLCLVLLSKRCCCGLFYCVFVVFCCVCFSFFSVLLSFVGFSALFLVSRALVAVF